MRAVLLHRGVCLSPLSLTSRRCPRCLQALSVVAQALGANGVGFAWLKGRQTAFKALSAFRNQPASQARALLLPLKQGANGLTLVEARNMRVPS